MRPTVGGTRRFPCDSNASHSARSARRAHSARSSDGAMALCERTRGRVDGLVRGAVEAHRVGGALGACRARSVVGAVGATRRTGRRS